MKISKEHYEYIKKQITNQFSREWVNIYAQDIQSEYKIKGKGADKVNMRVRNDLLYNASLTKFVCDTLYKYCDGTHVDSALKKLMRESYPHAIK